MQAYKPLTFAPDVAEDVQNAYWVIAKKLVRITTAAATVEASRNKLRALEPKDVDAESLDEMRRLSAELLDLVKEELQVRQTELAKWFPTFRREVSRLRDEMIKNGEKARAAVRADLEGIGFLKPAMIKDSQGNLRQAADPLAGTISLHPTVRAISDRLERLRSLGWNLDNGPEKGPSFPGYPPVEENLRRCEYLTAAIKEAQQGLKSPMAQAGALI